MKEPLGIMILIIPPWFSIPRDNGVASIMTRPSVSFPSSPQIIPP